MKVTPILKGAIDKLGRQPIQIRINEASKRRFIPTHIKVKPSEWDSETGKVKATNPAAKLLNERIKAIILKVEIGEIAPTKEKKEKDFFAYCYDCLNEWDKTKAPNTLRDYTGQMNKIRAYSPALSLSDITPDWLKHFKTHLFKVGHKNNVVWKTLKFVRLIVTKAFNEDLIESNPFKKFQMPVYKHPSKQYLSKEHVEHLEKALPTLQPHLRFAATWFLIGCYTGLRYSDMHAFNKQKNIIGNRLVVKMQKTKETIGMPLTDKVAALLESIEYKPLFLQNQPYNRSLKEIAKAAEIETPITGHASRHTFAMLCANAGISQEVTAKLLGHKSLEQTGIYYKISDSRVDNELNKLF